MALHIIFQESILIGAGWKPGWSTDYIAVLLAKKFEEHSVINLSNIGYVYGEDPRLNPEAERYEHMTWKAFRKIVGNQWHPGMSAPFDPIASKESERLGLKVAVLNGKDLDNLNNYLDGNAFKGTLIE